ncbi:MAG TPA: hypothetical protein V6D08_15530 [Candidatus Obscuribacterales bacterium]
MQLREKVLLCGIPYLAAGYLWFALTNPALVAGQDKNSQLSEKQKEQIELKTKLFDMARLEKEHARLEKEIADLRGSVPKSPDIDILLIDLEKMCLQSGMEVVGVEPPEREKQKKIEEEELPPPTATGMVETKPGLASAKEQLARAAAGTVPAQQPGGKAAAGAAPQVETGLSKLVKQVTVAGDYPGLVELMKRLESYQRVIGINQVEAEVPPEVGQKKVQEVRHLIVTFLMTAYYLP